MLTEKQIKELKPGSQFYRVLFCVPSEGCCGEGFIKVVEFVEWSPRSDQPILNVKDVAILGNDSENLWMGEYQLSTRDYYLYGTLGEAKKDLTDAIEKWIENAQDDILEMKTSIYELEKKLETIKKV